MQQLDSDDPSRPEARYGMRLVGGNIGDAQGIAMLVNEAEGSEEQ